MVWCPRLETRDSCRAICTRSESFFLATTWNYSQWWQVSPSKLSPHQRPNDRRRHPGWACPCKGLFPYTSCIPVLHALLYFMHSYTSASLLCLDALLVFGVSSLSIFFQFRRSFSPCWLRYSFYLHLPPFWPIGALHFTFPRPGAFTSLPQSFHRTYTIFMTWQHHIRQRYGSLPRIILELDKMASTARMLMTRGLDSTTGVVQAHRNGTSNNETLALISSLVFAESKSVRTSTIILAAFNVLAASTTAASILYDCYWASKRCNPKFKASYVGFNIK